jgi:hypothetical protein
MPPTHTIPNLPPAATFDVLHTLRTTLPPPAAGTEGSLEARIETAMGAVIAYRPADIPEACSPRRSSRPTPRPWIASALPWHRTPMPKPPDAAAARPPP